jgi:transcriptional regulator with XRE-family HTH domain
MPVNTSRIRELREKRGLTQQEAAEKSGLKTKQAWNNIEKGRQTNMTVETLEKVAKGLGVKVSALLVDEKKVQELQPPSA